MPEKFQFEAGEKPETYGTYMCMDCGEGFLVPEMGKELPKCPKCSGTLWYRVTSWEKQ